MDWGLFITWVVLAAALSMDSFAVSVGCGISLPQIRFQQAVPLAFSLAVFQGGFTLLGWLLGSFVADYISFIDHWIAFNSSLPGDIFFPSIAKSIFLNLYCFCICI